MRLVLKINDVEGQDDQKRHILLIDEESLREALMEHEGWLSQNVIREWLMKKKPRMLAEVIDDPQIRNIIYMQEKAKREEKVERKRIRLHTEQELAEKKEALRRAKANEQFEKSMEYRRSMDFYKQILGIDEE